VYVCMCVRVCTYVPAEVLHAQATAIAQHVSACESMHVCACMCVCICTYAPAAVFHAHAEAIAQHFHVLSAVHVLKTLSLVITHSTSGRELKFENFCRQLRK